MAKAKKSRKASAKKPAAKKARKTAKKARKAAPKKARKTAKKATRKTARKATRKAAKKATRKTTRKATKKAAKKTTRKATKKTAKKARAKRAPNPAFMKPLQPDAALSAVVGSAPQPRTEITKKIWAYIKRNNLQDARERRMINADDKLRPVFGGKSRVSMFEMTKLVNNHLK